MNTTIVGIRYKDKKTGMYGGKTYNYLCSIPVVVGDIVLAPTAKGDSLAMISEIDVSESQIEAHILPMLKTITSFAEETEAQV